VDDVRVIGAITRKKEVGMRSLLSRSIVLAVAFLGFAGVTANAAVTDTLEVKIPFAFVVNGRTFPAGQYRVEPTGMSSTVLLLRGEKGNHAAVFVPMLPAGGHDHDPAGNVPALSFTHDENQYRLSSVWESGTDGLSVAGH
jgi:hypothetical protein